MRDVLSWNTNTDNAKIELAPLKVYFNTWQEITLRFCFILLWLLGIFFITFSGLQTSYIQYLQAYRTNFITYQQLLSAVLNTTLLVACAPLIIGIGMIIAWLLLKHAKVLWWFTLINATVLILMYLAFAGFDIYVSVLTQANYVLFIIIGCFLLLILAVVVLLPFCVKELKHQLNIKMETNYLLNKHRYIASEKLQYDAKQKLMTDDIEDVITAAS